MKTSRYNFVLYDEYYGYWYNSLSGFYFRLSLELSRKIESSLNCLDVLKREATPLYDNLLNMVLLSKTMLMSWQLLEKDIKERFILKTISW